MATENATFSGTASTDFAGAVKRRRIIRQALLYLFLTVWAAAVLFPFYWMVLTSFKTQASYNSEQRPKFYVSAPTTENYSEAFTAVPLARYFGNTLVYTVVTTGLMMVVIILAAFAFARLEFKGKTLVFTLFLSLMMIPNELVIITNYVTITEWNLRNSFVDHVGLLHLSSQGDL